MRTGDRPRSVAFYSPGWPPNRTQNGISTYVGCLRSALRDLGVVSHVVTGTTFGSDITAADAIDLGKMRVPRGRRALFRLLDRVPGLALDGVSFGWSVARGVKHIVEQPPDLVEMEETFGGAWYTQQVMTIPLVVRFARDERAATTLAMLARSPNTVGRSGNSGERRSSVTATAGIAFT